MAKGRATPFPWPGLARGSAPDPRSRGRPLRIPAASGARCPVPLPCLPPCLCNREERGGRGLARGPAPGPPLKGTPLENPRRKRGPLPPVFLSFLHLQTEERGWRWLAFRLCFAFRPAFAIGTGLFSCIYKRRKEGGHGQAFRFFCLPSCFTNGNVRYGRASQGLCPRTPAQGDTP